MAIPKPIICNGGENNPSRRVRHFLLQDFPVVCAHEEARPYDNSQNWVRVGYINPKGELDHLFITHSFATVIEALGLKRVGKYMAVNPAAITHLTSDQSFHDRPEDLPDIRIHFNCMALTINDEWEPYAPSIKDISLEQALAQLGFPPAEELIAS